MLVSQVSLVLGVLHTSKTEGHTRMGLGAVAESVEHWSRVWEIVGSNAGRVKLMTYTIDTCHFLARCSASLG